MTRHFIVHRIAGIFASVAAICALVAVMATPSMAQPPKSVDARVKHQDARIKAAVKNHEISKSQAKKLIKHENAIKHTAAVERSRNGGHLMAAERAKLEHSLDKTSKVITAKEHGK